MSQPYVVSTIGNVSGDSLRSHRRELAMGSVAEVLSSHGGPYVIFGVGVLLGVAVGFALSGEKKRV